jgi:hypothetical protein
MAIWEDRTLWSRSFACTDGSEAKVVFWLTDCWAAHRAQSFFDFSTPIHRAEAYAGIEANHDNHTCRLPGRQGDLVCDPGLETPSLFCGKVCIFLCSRDALNVEAL